MVQSHITKPVFFNTTLSNKNTCELFNFCCFIAETFKIFFARATRALASGQPSQPFSNIELENGADPSTDFPRSGF